jgi:hypothetical protein
MDDYRGVLIHSAWSVLLAVCLWDFGPFGAAGSVSFLWFLRELDQVAPHKPGEGLKTFTTWSLTKHLEYLVPGAVVFVVWMALHLFA